MTTDKKNDPKRIVTGTARLAFAQLHERKAYGSGRPKYSCTLIFLDGTDRTPYERAYKAAYVEKFGSTFVPPKSAKAWNNPIRDNDEKAHVDGFQKPGFFINVSTENAPVLVDRQLQRYLDPGEIKDALYSGCWVRAAIRAYAFDNESKGVAFGLESLQKVKDGERLGRSVVAPEQDFSRLEDDEDTVDPFAA